MTNKHPGLLVPTKIRISFHEQSFPTKTDVSDKLSTKKEEIPPNGKPPLFSNLWIKVTLHKPSFRSGCRYPSQLSAHDDHSNRR